MPHKLCLGNCVHDYQKEAIFCPGQNGEPSSGVGAFSGGGVEREDSELLLTQAAVDAMPPRKSLVRRPSVVQFAEMQEAAASLAREAAQQSHAQPPAKLKTKFQVAHNCIHELQRSPGSVVTWILRQSV